MYKNLVNILNNNSKLTNKIVRLKNSITNKIYRVFCYKITSRMSCVGYEDRAKN